MVQNKWYQNASLTLNYMYKGSTIIGRNRFSSDSHTVYRLYKTPKTSKFQCFSILSTFSDTRIGK